MSDNKKIILFGIVSELIYASFLLIDPWRHQVGDNSLAISSSGFFVFLTILLLLLFFVYFYISKIHFDKKTFFLVMIFFGIFSLTTFLIRPLTSIDIYTYIHTGRVLSVHQANPYMMSYDDFPLDSFASTIKNQWSGLPTPYASFFTIISAGLTFVGQKSFDLSLYIFKVFFIIINIFSCYLIYKISNNYKIAFLYAWNPLILFEIGVNGHNDVLLILFLLLSFLFIYSRSPSIKNYLWAFVFLCLSVMIKYITIIFLPIFFLFILKNFKEVKEQFKVALLLAGTFFVLIFLFYFPFWAGVDTFARIVEHADKLYNPLLLSPLIILLATIFHYIHIGYPVYFGVWFSKTIFIVFYSLVLIKVLQHKNIDFKKLAFYFVVALSIFYFTFLTWLVPWYFSVLIVLLLLSWHFNNNRRFIYAVHLFTLWGILYNLVLR